MQWWVFSFTSMIRSVLARRDGPVDEELLASDMVDVLDR